MDMATTVEALSALAHETRLAVFRMLIEEGPTGLPATEIARRIGAGKSLMSSHLAILTRAALIDSKRDGRRIIYSVNLEETRSLLAFLVQDCCKVNPSDCDLVLDAIHCR